MNCNYWQPSKERVNNLILKIVPSASPYPVSHALIIIYTTLAIFQLIFLKAVSSHVEANGEKHIWNRLVSLEFQTFPAYASKTSRIVLFPSLYCHNVVSKKFALVRRPVSGWSARSKLELAWCNVSDAACLSGFLFRLPVRGFTDPRRNSSSWEMLRPESDTENRDSGPEDSTERGFGLRTASPLTCKPCLEKSEILSLFLLWLSPWSLMVRKYCGPFFRCGL